MNTRVSSNKKQTAFRFSEDLLERLKVRAKKDNRSLNNYVEKILMEAVYDEPNEETVGRSRQAAPGQRADRLPECHSRYFPESIPDSFQPLPSLPFASALKPPENRKGKESNR